MDVATRSRVLVIVPAAPVTSRKEAWCRLDTVFSVGPVQPATCHCRAEGRPWYHGRGCCCADVCLLPVTKTPHVSVRGVQTGGPQANRRTVLVWACERVIDHFWESRSVVGPLLVPVTAHFPAEWRAVGAGYLTRHISGARPGIAIAPFSPQLRPVGWTQQRCGGQPWGTHTAGDAHPWAPRHALQGG